MTNTFAKTLVAFLILAALMLANGFGLLSPVLDWGRISTGLLITPFVAVFGTARNFGQTAADIRDLAEQNSLLESQVQKLTSELALLEKASEENKALRQALGFEAKSRLNLISAEVLTVDSLEQMAALKAGSRQGVAAGDSVVVSGSVLVCTVTQVSENTSQMQLITSSATAVNARTASGSASGIVHGEHGLGLLLDQVARTEVLKAGDRVMASGLGGKYLGNLFIGTIGEIRSSSELFQSASVVPAADLRDLRFVFVVKKE